MRSWNRRRSIVAGAAALLCLILPAAALAESAAIQQTSTPAAPADMQSVPASETITVDEARSIAQKYFKLPEGPGELETHLSARGGRQVWEFMYTLREENGSTSYGIGSVDAVTGQIIDFNLSYPDLRPIRTGPLGPGHPRWAAEKKAWALVEEIYPDMAGRLRPMPESLAGGYPYYYFYGPDDYALHAFTWLLYEGGVPVPSRSIRVALDKETLDYVSLTANLQENITFAAGPAQLSAAEARAMFEQNLTPQLSYQLTGAASPYVDPGSLTELQLVYQTLPGVMVDAVTGKLIDSYGREITAALLPEAVGPAPDGAVVAPPATLPLDEASAIAYARTLLNPPADAQADISPRMGPASQSKEISVHFWGGQDGSSSITLDRQTGRVRYANRSVNAPWQPNTPPLTDEQKSQAKQAAILAVQQFYSGIADKLKLTPQPDLVDRPPTLNFFFQRYEHNIPVIGNGIHVTIDTRTTEWANLSLSWTNAQSLPDPSTALSAAQVRQRIMDRTEAVLSYQVKQPLPGPGYRPPDSSQPQDALLVYLLSARKGEPPYFTIDAVTGEPIVYSAPAQRSAAEVDRLLAGSRAEGEMRYLLSRSLLPIAKLDPEGSLSRFDALNILLNAPAGVGWYSSGVDPVLPFADVTPESPMYQLVVRAYTGGILKPASGPTFAGDEPVTRAEFAVWMVRALGLGELARTPLVTTTTGFSDMRRLTREQQNAVAFLEALGILKPAALFQGNSPLTQADAAMWVVQMANRSKTR